MTEHQDDIPGPEDTTEEEISPAPSPRSSADPLLGTKIGSCTLKRLIGSGGMGTVYEAIQEKPRRRVALKMMKRGITSRSATRRFEFESQTLARLQHPGVAQIYEAGTHDDGSGGVPYFVMEYIANAKPITQYADEMKLGTKERLSLFTKVCDAVQHGHLKGIVHRDLKPGNILVDSSGQPKIIDFGVARSTDSDMAVTTLQTDVGQLIGTLQYMSPEQCEADPSDIDVRSDVYALGVILYELLTGKPPYDLKQKAIHEAVRIVREEEPTKLSTVDRHLRGDIETISIKALEKNRDRRYQSAIALQDDILHYLNDEPISAKPPGAIDYMYRFARRHTASTFATLTVFALVIPICTYAYFSVSELNAKMETDAKLMDVIEQQSEKTEQAMMQVVIGQAKSIVANDILQRLASESIAEYYDNFETLQLDDIIEPEKSVVIIPLIGQVVSAQNLHQSVMMEVFNSAMLDQLLNEIKEEHPEVTSIVLRINSSGGSVDETYEVLKVLDKHKEHFRFTAWVKEALDASFPIAFACNELYMDPLGYFGTNYIRKKRGNLLDLSEGESIDTEYINKIDRLTNMPTRFWEGILGRELWYNNEKQIWLTEVPILDPLVDNWIEKYVGQDLEKYIPWAEMPKPAPTSGQKIQSPANNGGYYFTASEAIDFHLSAGIAGNTDELLQLLNISNPEVQVYYASEKIEIMSHASTSKQLDALLESAIRLVNAISTVNPADITPTAAALLALDQDDPDNRVQGVKLLAGASFGGKPPYVALYRDYVKVDDDPLVRSVAINALILHGENEDAKLIVEWLNRNNTNNFQLRLAAAVALQWLKHTYVVKDLLRSLRDSDEDIYIRAVVASALGQYPENRVFEGLVATLVSDADTSLKIAVGQSLEKLTGESFGTDWEGWYDWGKRVGHANGALFVKGSSFQHPSKQDDINISNKSLWILIEANAVLGDLRRSIRSLNIFRTRKKIDGVEAACIFDTLNDFIENCPRLTGRLDQEIDTDYVIELAGHAKSEIMKCLDVENDDYPKP